MRGKVVVFYTTKCVDRITPAYAGKRDLAITDPIAIWDHPCVCGEKVIKYVIKMTRLGSPLRMRGKVCRTLDGEYKKRITPAYAGKR